MPNPQLEFEGTWGEIAAHASEFEGRRLRVTVLDDEEPKALSLQDRLAFLKLPLSERRRILAQQAEEIAPYYERNTGWRDFLEGDIVEY